MLVSLQRLLHKHRPTLAWDIGDGLVVTAGTSWATIAEGEHRLCWRGQDELKELRRLLGTFRSPDWQSLHSGARAKWDNGCIVIAFERDDSAFTLHPYTRLDLGHWLTSLMDNDSLVTPPSHIFGLAVEPEERAVVATSLLRLAEGGPGLALTLADGELTFTRCNDPGRIDIAGGRHETTTISTLAVIALTLLAEPDGPVVDWTVAA